ncbi:MAG: diguanylate cyclase [Rhizobiaceae bacterium]|nr:diguanylate cyclase [Rhizobiaceae bacterium]
MEPPDHHERNLLARLVAQTLRRRIGLPAFPKPLEERFEEDRRDKRIAHLRISIVLGLVIYNLFNLTDAILIPDIAHFSWAIRLLILTPGAVALLWLLGQPFLPARWREWSVAAAMTAFSLGPLLLFHLSEAELHTLVLTQIILTLFFASSVLQLRYDLAAIVYLVNFAATAAAIVLVKDVSIELAGVFLAYAACASIFGFVCNLSIERSVREAYLLSLQERLRSDGLREDRNKLAVLSATDWLTGTANRRSLEDQMARIWADPIRRAETAVILLDIDHFKRFNDFYGHQVGDDCLRRIAALLVSACERPGVFLARYGGEEFAIVIEEMTEADATAFALDICRTVARSRIAHRGRQDGLDMVTISLGVARLGDDSSVVDVDRLFAAADEALYAAKRLGRNRVVRFGSLEMAIAEGLQVSGEGAGPSRPRSESKLKERKRLAG